MGKEIYAQEKRRVSEINTRLRQENPDNQFAELGYLDMHSRALNLEQQQEEYTLDAAKWEQRKNEHLERKKQIEDYWHTSTAEKKAQLAKRVTDSQQREKDNRRKAYYDSFSLKELEIFIKNSNINGNSDKFNDVATDLELYNASSEHLEAQEAFELLQRLEASCDTYIQSRNPWSKEGKRRKAMIEQVRDKVRLEIETRKARLFTNSDETYAQINENAEHLDQVSLEHAEGAMKAKFDLLSQYLQGNVTLDDEQRQRLDQEASKVVEALVAQQVDEDQADTFSTKFFNALGWTSRGPRLVDRTIHGDDEDAQIHTPLYHTIQPLPGDKDALQLIRQLRGQTDARHYLSGGKTGRGTYTAARGFKYNDLKGKEADRLDKAASQNSWEYGKELGSRQVTMVFNEKAKIIDFEDAKKLIQRFHEKFPQLGRAMSSNEDIGGYGTDYDRAATSIVAFFGYNTIRVEGSRDGSISYYVTTDRSAFTVESDMSFRRIGNEGGDKDFDFME